MHLPRRGAGVVAAPIGAAAVAEIGEVDRAPARRIRDCRATPACALKRRRPDRSSDGTLPSCRSVREVTGEEDVAAEALHQPREGPITGEPHHPVSPTTLTQVEVLRAG